MAASDRRNLNLDDFVGLNWSCWVDRVNILPSDAASNAEESKNGIKGPETMTLLREDMHIYGHCPAHDDFYLVVCSHCGQVVKPQAFEKHCEKWHGPVIRMCGQSSPQRPSAASCASPCIWRQKDGRSEEGSILSTATSSGHQNRPSKEHKEAVSLSSVKLSEEKSPLLHSSSTLHPRVPPWPSAPLPPGDRSSSCSSSSAPLSERLQSTDSHCPVRGMRTYSRTHKNVNKKVGELNKNIKDPEKKKLCNRELLCNTNSLHQQQKASAKPKVTDQLAAEQKPTERRETEQLPVKSRPKEKHADLLEERKTAEGGKYNFNGICHILRPKNQSESFPQEKGGNTVDVDVQPPYPCNQSLLSSEDSNEDEQEEGADLPASPWHPKPLGLCTFGCRTLGCNIFTFDRRFHHLRFAVSAMLERHVNAHLWRKMPQVSSGLRSHRVTPPIKATPVRTGDKTSKSTGSLCLESTSVGQPETKSSQQNSHTTKRPYSCTSDALALGRRCNLAGRSGKTQLREVELMQDANTALKAAKPPHSSEDKSPRRVRDHPLHEKSQTLSCSSEALGRGTPSHVKKPCRPLSLNPAERLASDLKKCPPLPAPAHRAPRSRGGAQGALRKVVDYNQRGLVQKRKGSRESLSPSSSLSKSPKYKCLSSPSRSNIVSWKGETIEEVLACGLEKRSDS